MRGGFIAEFAQQRQSGSRYRLWTSPYRRTRETAQEIQREAGDLIESCRESILLAEQQFGLFDGVARDKLPRVFPAEHSHYQKAADAGGRFWARPPQGESRFDVAVRVHQAFGTFHRDALGSGIENLIVVAHGVTIRAFRMMWCHYSYEWFEAEPNPANGSVWLLENGRDEGCVFTPTTGEE